MMSRQMSTHSSQMKTVGPAMSFLTSRWLLLQKEQRSASSPVSFFAISPPPDPFSGRRAVCRLPNAATARQSG